MLKNKLLLLFSISLSALNCNGDVENISDKAYDNILNKPDLEFCNANVDNFKEVEDFNLEGTYYSPTWGISMASLPFPRSLSICKNSASWSQKRLLYSATYWINKKLNYCHHYIPTWQANSSVSYAECSDDINIMPSNSDTLGKIIRWNYSGLKGEEALDWYNNFKNYPIGNYGFGVDCSIFTKLVYNFGNATFFSGAIRVQAGQNDDSLAPNIPGFVDRTIISDDRYNPAGNLLCADGTPETYTIPAKSNSCSSHGGYISVFEQDGSFNSNAITDSMLSTLKPGDLIYIAGSAKNSRKVTHVVMWTGEKIGFSNIISTNMIAPQPTIDIEGKFNNQCEKGFWLADNNLGLWIIADSHYQGPDFRAFTPCFYRNQVWGIRRIIMN